MAIFPEKMLNTKLSLDGIASKLTYYHLQAQLYHWQTFAGFEHSATGELYELLFSFKDELIEKIMGYENKRINSFNILTLKNHSTGSSKSLVNEIILFCRELEEFGKKSNMCDVENMAQDLSGSCARINYKLTFT